MKITQELYKKYRYLIRNERSFGGKQSNINKINLEYWDTTDNIGDALAPVIYQWILDYYGLDMNYKCKKTRHLLTVGSILGMNNFDAVVWGSGVHTKSSMRAIQNQSKFRKLDIRIVRGPVTEMVLAQAGYDCPQKYGDPAVLLPLIYKPDQTIKRYKVSVIPHISDMECDSKYHMIDVRTKDYKRFIDEIVSSELVVSTSLHGLILAEAYGIPAIFYNNQIDSEIYKYFDWYFSTGRYDIKIAQSVEEAIAMKPMKTPEITKLQNALITSFPVELWKE